MSDNDDSKETTSVDRREFVRAAAGSVAGAGVISALGTGLLMQPTEAAAAVNQKYDFPRPEGLLPGAALDSRFPVSFSESVQQGLRLVMDYFTALNQRDLQGIAKTLHFPFAIYEEIEPIVVNSEAEFMRKPPPSLNGTGNGFSTILEGSYDILEGINVHLYCPVGSVISLRFTRYTPYGYKLFEGYGLFSVTNNDRRWGIQLVSNIVCESGYEERKYPDAGMFYRMAGEGYLAPWGYRNEELLDDLLKARGAFTEPLPIGTRTARVSLGYGPRDRTRDAKANEPMKGWIVDGVKSRLSVSVVDGDERSGEHHTNLDEFVSLAGGTVGKYGYSRLRPTTPLVIHATHDKAHVLGGYWRYTYDGVLISETRSVGIQIYKGGHWHRSSSLGQVTHHDRSNSKAG